MIGICLDNTAAAQRNVSGCEFCEMKLTWKTYSVVLFYPFYDIYSLAYSSIANVKESLIYIIITLKTATQHLKVSFQDWSVYTVKLKVEISYFKSFLAAVQ